MKKVFTQIVLATSVSILSLNVNAQNINTFAGTGITGFSGDGGSASTAQIGDPFGVAVDLLGNVYIADFVNHRIRKVNTSGIISTFAGTGVPGFSGDGASATLAQLNYPTSIAVDSSGNVYIADKDNVRIRKVNTLGVISTIAGTGVSGYSGDGATATLAELNGLYGIAVDGMGNVYFADQSNYRIRKINILGVISTFAGTGISGFSGDGAAANLAQINGARGVAVDTLGNVYISDLNNHRIRKINTSGIISTIAGTGVAGYNGDGAAATLAELNNPYGLAVDVSGNVFISDWFNNRIRKINTSGVISTFAGTGVLGFSGDGGPAVSAQLNRPTELAVDVTSVYISDQDNNRVRKVTLNTGMEQFENNNNFILYPNPTNGSFNIFTSQQIQNGSIEIYNTIGELIFSQKIVNQQNTIDLKNQASGLYFVKVISDGEVIGMKKVVKE